MIELSYTKSPGHSKESPSYLATIASDITGTAVEFGSIVKSTVTTPAGEFPCWKFVSAHDGLEHADRKTQKDVKAYVESWVLERIAQKPTSD